MQQTDEYFLGMFWAVIIMRCISLPTYSHTQHQNPCGVVCLYDGRRHDDNDNSFAFAFVHTDYVFACRRVRLRNMCRTFVYPLSILCIYMYIRKERASAFSRDTDTHKYTGRVVFTVLIIPVAVVCREWLEYGWREEVVLVVLVASGNAIVCRQQTDDNRQRESESESEIEQSPVSGVVVLVSR